MYIQAPSAHSPSRAKRAEGAKPHHLRVTRLSFVINDNMALNKLTALAFSVYSNKGAYALLCGAGISRSAGIKTGWNIEEDLIQKVAATQGIVESDDWHIWYKNEYGREADYSTLLSEVVSSPTERVQLMKEYFEPSEEEREDGLKQPTKAHRAIAELSKEGFIKVIISPNFDRLFEQALQEVGIQPQVVYHADDLNKITPLVHSGVTIVKLNGDYLDCRFRNTTEELDSYQPAMKTFLSRIFEDFGLITCGWSAQWDKGLVDIILNSASSRYGSYVTFVGKAGEPLEIIATKRHGELMSIEGADYFFSELKEQVLALNTMNASKSLSKDVFLGRVKKYISNDKLMELTELLETESKSAHEKIMQYANYSSPVTPDLFQRYLSLHIEVADKLMAAAVIIARWGRDEHVLIFKDILKRLCYKPFRNGEITCEYTQYLHLLAANFLFNTIGVSCIKYRKFGVLEHFFCEKTSAIGYFAISQPVNLIYLIGYDHWGKDLLNSYMSQNFYVPFSMLKINTLRDYFADIFLTPEEYEQTYNIWEQLFSLLYEYYNCDQFANLRDEYFPIGNFLRSRVQYSRYPDCEYNTFFAQADYEKDQWAPIAQGLFSGKYDDYKDCLDKANEYYKQCHSVWH